MAPEQIRDACTMREPKFSSIFGPPNVPVSVPAGGVKGSEQASRRDVSATRFGRLRVMATSQ